MKKLKHLFAAALLLASCVVTTRAATAQAKPGEVVYQTGFEDTQSVPSPADLEGAGASLTTGRKSARALLVERSSDGTSLVHLSLPVEKLRGTLVRYSVFVKAQGVAPPSKPEQGVKVDIRVVTPTGARFTGAQNRFGSGDWKPLMRFADIPADATAVELVLGIENRMGKAWFDDVEVAIANQPQMNPADKGHAVPRLRGAMLGTDLTEKDIRTFGTEWNANVARYQLKWSGTGTSYPFGPADTAEPEEYDAWLESALQKLDALLPAFEKNGVLVVVDLHTPPGGRVKGHLAMRMFEDKRFQEQFVRVWEKIARRYKNNKVIWGYDLINEPQMGKVAADALDYRTLMTQAAQRIREIEPERTLILEADTGGNPRGFNSDFTPISIERVVYSPHMYLPLEFTHQGVDKTRPEGVVYPGTVNGKYWGKAELRQALQGVLNFQRAYGVPMYVGEFSAIRWAPGDSAEHYLRDCIEIFEENGWDWTYHAFRESSAWSVEIGGDKDNKQPSPTETGRKKLLRSWFAKNQKPNFADVKPAEGQQVQDEKLQNFTDVKPAEVKQVRGEKLQLSAQAPRGHDVGTRLKQLIPQNPNSGVTARGSLIASSVVVRSGATTLEEGRDYLLTHDWGMLGIGPNSRVTPNDTVTVDYDYSLMRLDSLVRGADGKEFVKPGNSSLTSPQAPILAPGETRVANLFMPYGGDSSHAELFPILETAAQAQTLSTNGHIPKTLAKLRAGQAVKIVCWGDSVTAGSEASGPATRYPTVLQQRLKQQFPNAHVEVETIAIGSSKSDQWLDPVKYPFPTPEKQAAGKFERIINAKPDLVTVEFVNDASYDAAHVAANYGEILKRLRAVGAEVILITPHFTNPEMMGFQSSREPEKRPYVFALRDFATQNQLGLADASARWAHLWREGIPYVTYLHNGINHPDDRGHAIFADELMKNFAS